MRIMAVPPLPVEAVIFVADQYDDRPCVARRLLEGGGDTRCVGVVLDEVIAEPNAIRKRSV